MNTKYPLFESLQNILIHPDKNRDKTTNYFQSNRPKKILIYDTYNNPFFQFKDITIDKSTFDLPKLENFLNKLYGYPLDFLPFHFYIEYINDEYYIFNTRPLLLKPFIQDKEYINYLHICILGDSNTDLYDRTLYSKLKSLLNTLCYFFYKSKLNKQYIESLMGKHFVLDYAFN